MDHNCRFAAAQKKKKKGKKREETVVAQCKRADVDMLMHFLRKFAAGIIYLFTINTHFVAATTWLLWLPPQNTATTTNRQTKKQ